MASQLNHIAKPCHPEYTLSPASNGDWIPMGWSKGDKIQLSYGIAHQIISAMVLKAEEPTYLIGDYKGRFYLVDLVGNQFIELDDSDLCSSCGQILCEHQSLQSLLASAGARETEQPEQTPPPMAIKPVPFKDLENAEHDDPIACIEGKVLTIYDPKTGTSKGGRTYWFQSIIVKDANGDEQRVSLADKKFKLEQGNKGTTYRWTAKAGKDGTTGIKFNISGDEGQYRQIQVTSTATQEVVSGAKPSEARSNAGAGTSSSSGSGGGRVDDKALELNAAYPAPFRIGQYFDILQLVQAENETRKTGLELEQQKDVATTIFLSFKGPYATYAPCVLKAGEAPPPAGISSWKDYVYPSRNKKLGDMDQAELVPLVAWAYSTSEPKSDEAKRTVANLIMAAVEHKLTPTKTITAWFSSQDGTGLDGEFTEEHLERAIAAKFPDFDGISLSQLSDDQAKQVLPKKVLEELLASALKIAQDEASNAGGDDDIPM